MLIDYLERIESRKITRLLVTMPPGAAKSTYSSILFPAWVLARDRTASVLAASHTVELATRFGRKTRNLVDEHCETLDVHVSDDSHAAYRWATVDGAEYYAAGAGVGIAGFRADLAIIDDPIRSREDADSLAVRNKIWEWYKADLGPRLRPRARIILIQTRWHEDDLAGRILDEMKKGGEEYHQLCLPAEARENDPLGRAPGEFLWADDDYGYAAFLRREKQTQTARNYSALYQQEPSPEGGHFFKADWLRPYDTPPARETLAIYGASDYAVTANGGDYTVHVVVGVDPEGRLWLLDLWRKQAASDEWVDSWCDLVKHWNPLDWAEEQGQIESGIGPFRDARARQRKAYCNCELFPTRVGKAARAQSIRGRMALTGLYVPTSAPWFPDLRAELLAFDAGKHDDQVDALGLVGQLLDRMIDGRETPKPDEPRAKEKHTDYRPIDLSDRDDWRAY